MHLSFIINQRIKKMNYSQMFDMISEIHDKTGISKAKLEISSVDYLIESEAK